MKLDTDTDTIPKFFSSSIFSLATSQRDGFNLLTGWDGSSSTGQRRSILSLAGSGGSAVLNTSASSQNVNMYFRATSKSSFAICLMSGNSTAGAYNGMMFCSQCLNFLIFNSLGLISSNDGYLVESLGFGRLGNWSGSGGLGMPCSLKNSSSPSS